ncbi:hypothetical protein [Natronorubrum sp. DTA28]|uniref:hypothetical protein n=1 Tax=Natronorubrum sp. DTA28 TaxID=3447019 RepID=UPI003F8761D5
MSFESLLLTSKVVADTILNRQTGSKIEKELNDHFNGWEKRITSYEGKPIKLEVESIAVRPMYWPKKLHGGILEAEAESYFTELEKERERSTVLERASAVTQGKWITVVRLNMEEGNAEDIRPDGLNLSFVTTKLSLSEVGRQIRVAETSEIQSDKLEVKIVHHTGDIAEYREEINDTMDLLEHVQENMKEHVIWYLLELYHSYDGGSDSTWPDDEQARKLGGFLVDMPVTPEEVTAMVERVKDEMEDAPKRGNQ